LWVLAQRCIITQNRLKNQPSDEDGDLYGLTAEEIAIVEQGGKDKS